MGITTIGGPAQMVRPLVVPMAEGAIEATYGEVPEDISQKVRGHSAAVDNIGLFFGEDIFIAVGAVLFMKGFFDQNHVHSSKPDGLWAIPIAVAVFVIHAIRLYLLDKSIKRRLGKKPAQSVGSRRL